jgi:beta-phosphoglucomutase-like phosphatase (HAD superfamily)
MGAAPESRIVVEDSVPGVTAARAAGMTALGFCGGGHCLDGHGTALRAAGATTVFATMAELGAYLGAM